MSDPTNQQSRQRRILVEEETDEEYNQALPLQIIPKQKRPKLTETESSDAPNLSPSNVTNDIYFPNLNTPSNPREAGVSSAPSAIPNKGTATPSLSLHPPSLRPTNTLPVSRPVEPVSSAPKLPLAPRSVSGTLLVKTAQQANPVLTYIKAVPKVFNPYLIPDFVMNSNTCALFLSVKYHLAKPTYIEERASKLPPAYALRLLLVLVDQQENTSETIMYLNKLAIRQNMTLLLCWSNKEVARYLETYVLFENRSADPIRERSKDDYDEQVTDCLTAIRPITGSNVQTLLRNFGSLANIMAASMEQLSLCYGLGEKRVKRLYNAFNSPFVITATKDRPKANAASSSLEGESTSAAAKR